MRIAILLTIFFLTACGDSDGPKGKVYQSEGVALAGYDPVAYFEQGDALLGNVSTTSNYEGLTYQFTSSENKELFDNGPEKYLPAYGGWCAYAIAESSTKMEPDPTMWKIQNGELLLFYDDWMTSLTGSLKEEWDTDEAGYKEKADTNWEVVE